jgi:hypothetical protein
MATPPNVANLSLPKGIIKGKPVGQSGALRDFGECSSFTTSMDVETLVYNSRRHSSRIPVATVTLGKTMGGVIAMNELAEENVEIWAMGESSGSPGVISIGTAAEVRYWIRYIGTNEVGPAYQVDLYNVLLTPNGDFEWLSDADWAEMQLTMSVNADQTTGSFGDIQPITAGVEVTAGSPPV